MKTPLIIPNFNQLFYLKNIINWWRWYHEDAINYPIYIVDNGSTYKPLLEFYERSDTPQAFKYEQNTFIPNLKDFLKSRTMDGVDYYVISDPDIMPHPATPKNFLEIFKKFIENNRIHRIGFNLITSDLPDYLNEREMIIGNEAELTQTVFCEYGNHKGYKAPIDTTFCLYTTKNRGWDSPMDGKDWGNCVRLFEAFHLSWYQDPNNVNEEMHNYYKTSKYRVPGEPSAGKNNNRPPQYL